MLIKKGCIEKGWSHMIVFVFYGFYFLYYFLLHSLFLFLTGMNGMGSGKSPSCRLGFHAFLRPGMGKSVVQISRGSFFALDSNSHFIPAFPKQGKPKDYPHQECKSNIQDELNFLLAD